MLNKYINNFAVLILVIIFINCKNINKNISRNSTENYYIQNEKTFVSLYDFFYSKTINQNKYIITFYSNKNNKLYNINIYPIDGPVNIHNSIIGGDNLPLECKKIDSILIETKWEKSFLLSLKDKLNKTNCKWIRTTEIYGDPIEIFYDESTYGSYSYLIFPQPLSDTLIKIHGTPIKSNILKDRVVVSYLSNY